MGSRWYTRYQGHTRFDFDRHQTGGQDAVVRVMTSWVGDPMALKVGEDPVNRISFSAKETSEPQLLAGIHLVQQWKDQPCLGVPISTGHVPVGSQLVGYVSPAPISCSPPGWSRGSNELPRPSGYRH